MFSLSLAFIDRRRRLREKRAPACNGATHVSRDIDNPENRHVDARDDGLTIAPGEVERMIACHKAISAAEKTLQCIIEEAAQEVEADRKRSGSPMRNAGVASGYGSSYS